MTKRLFTCKTLVARLDGYAREDRAAARSALDPPEDAITIALVQWCRVHHDGRELVYHVPNEAKRSKAGHGIMVAKGLVPGQPDLTIPVSRGGWNAFYQELKRLNQTPTASQIKRMAELEAAGNYCCWADNLDDAMAQVNEYMAGKLLRPNWVHYSHEVPR